MQLKCEVIPNIENSVEFGQRENCRKSTIASGIVLMQYNATCDRRFSAFWRGQTQRYFRYLVLLESAH